MTAEIPCVTVYTAEDEARWLAWDSIKVVLAHLPDAVTTYHTTRDVWEWLCPHDGPDCKNVQRCLRAGHIPVRGRPVTWDKRGRPHFGEAS